jgi:fucose permease
VVADLLRRSTFTVVTFSVYCAAPFLVVLFPGYQVLLVAFFLIGASTRLLDSLVNAYVADLHHQHRAFYLNLLHASFGIGALVGPSLSVLVLRRGLPWSRVFSSLAVFWSGLLMLGLCPCGLAGLSIHLALADRRHRLRRVAGPDPAGAGR